MSIVLEHLAKSFAGHPVVGNVSLEIPDGELFVLLGPSGSGKRRGIGDVFLAWENEAASARRSRRIRRSRGTW